MKLFTHRHTHAAADLRETLKFANAAPPKASGKPEGGRGAGGFVAAQFSCNRHLQCTLSALLCISWCFSPLLGCLSFLTPQTPEGNYKPKVNAKSADPDQGATLPTLPVFTGQLLSVSIISCAKSANQPPLPIHSTLLWPDNECCCTLQMNNLCARSTADGWS